MTLPRTPPGRPRLVVLAPESAEATASFELSYLRRLVGWIAAPVFKTLPEDRVDEADAVLLLGSALVLVGPGYFREGWLQLQAGWDAVVPLLLSELTDARAPQIQTLRGFERLEAELLTPRAHPPGTNPARAVLVSVSAARRLASGQPIGASAVPAMMNGLGSLRACRLGLAHEFADYYGQVRVDVLPFIPPGAERVLEVGCARGATGALLRRECGVRVTGVELNPVVAAEAAKVLDEVICDDFERCDLAGGFDVVLALELFEHLVNPLAFLERARSLLRPGGIVVLSVPNVGHWSVVSDLLAGRWDYLPAGLICVTHVRFFTRRTLEAFLHMAGCDSFEILPQHTALPAEWAGCAWAEETDAESLRTKGFWVVVRR